MTKVRRYEVLFQPDGRAVEVEAGATLQRAAIAAGVPFELPCGGLGQCGQCRVEIIRGRQEPEADERRLLTRDQLAAGIRLACRQRVHGDQRERRKRAPLPRPRRDGEPRVGGAVHPRHAPLHVLVPTEGDPVPVVVTVEARDELGVDGDAPLRDAGAVNVPDEPDGVRVPHRVADQGVVALRRRVAGDVVPAPVVVHVGGHAARHGDGPEAEGRVEVGPAHERLHLPVDPRVAGREPRGQEGREQVPGLLLLAGLHLDAVEEGEGRVVALHGPADEVERRPRVPLEEPLLQVLVQELRPGPGAAHRPDLGRVPDREQEVAGDVLAHALEHGLVEEHLAVLRGLHALHGEHRPLGEGLRPERPDLHLADREPVLPQHVGVDPALPVPEPAARDPGRREPEHRGRLAEEQTTVGERVLRGGEVRVDPSEHLGRGGVDLARLDAVAGAEDLQPPDALLQGLGEPEPLAHGVEALGVGHLEPEQGCVVGPVGVGEQRVAEEDGLLLLHGAVVPHAECAQRVGTLRQQHVYLLK
ncbi:MAG: 2Fe-2S iron-sulfur cluster binding domain-containing protein [Armatimonadetes bacterium]|nr:2Fe-2S iron-sulfur cluster binding domain-containing protein [Armatimonadota bacterium]